MSSIVMPAHDEGSVIGRTLQALLSGTGFDDVEVVVVPNGCSDDTAAVARDFGGRVQVVELSRPSKAGALNAGDACATSFPRLYVDADVELSTDTARALLRLLDVPEPRLVVPTAEHRRNDSSWPVRAYVATFERLARHRADAGGSGVYGLNAAARARFDVFPELMADDLFVDQLFTGAERIRSSEVVVVAPPKHLRDLIAIRTRVYAANRQYAASDLGSGAGAAAANGRAFRALVRQPASWPSAAVYVTVSAWAKAAAARRLRRGTGSLWLRDESSRSSTSSGSEEPGGPAAPVRASDGRAAPASGQAPDARP